MDEIALRFRRALSVLAGLTAAAGFASGLGAQASGIPASKGNPNEICSPSATRLDANDPLGKALNALHDETARSRHVAETEPFRATFARASQAKLDQRFAKLKGIVRSVIGDRPSTDLSDRVTVPSTFLPRYSLGAVITAPDEVIDRGTEYLRLVQLADFSSGEFLANHCFSYGGVEGNGDAQIVRIDFQPLSTLKIPDLAGSVYFTLSPYRLVRSTTRVSRTRKVACGKNEITIETAFKDVASGIAYPSVMTSKQDEELRPNGSRSKCAERHSFESERLLGTTGGLSGPLAANLSLAAMSPADSMHVEDVVRKATEDYFAAWRKEWSTDQIEKSMREGTFQFKPGRGEGSDPTFPLAFGDTAHSDPAMRTRLLSEHCAIGTNDLAIRQEYGTSVHPHLIDGHGNRAQSSAANVCPIWVPDSIEPADAKWGIDFDLELGGRVTIRDRERKPLLRLLDSTATLLPGDPWIAGQRIRMLLEQGDVGHATGIADNCSALEWWCSALHGLIAYWTRDLTKADAEFQRSVAVMPAGIRCDWNDASNLLDVHERGPYAALTCDQRDSVNARLWWLGDPLYLEPGNSRRAEYYGRKMLIALRSALPYDERWDWGRWRGGIAHSELVERYGWPTSMRYLAQKPIGALTMLGAEPSGYDPIVPIDPADGGGAGPTLAAMIARDRGIRESVAAIENTFNTPETTAEYWGPQYHTLPPFSALANPFAIADTIWNLGPKRLKDGSWDQSWWPQEFSKRDDGPIVALENQVGIFRRASSAYLAAAGRWDTTGLGFNAPRTTVFGVVATDGPDSFLNSVADTSAPLMNAPVIMPVKSRPQILGVEMLPLAHVPGPARRARFGITPPPGLASLGPNDIAISDPFLVAAGAEDSSRTTLQEILPRMLRSTNLVDPKRLGVFWETYGLRDPDTTDVSLRIVRYDDRGLMTKALSIVGLAGSGSDSVTVHWLRTAQETTGMVMQDGHTIRLIEMTINVSALPAGRYLLQMTVDRRGTAPAVSRRDFTIARP